MTSQSKKEGIHQRVLVQHDKFAAYIGFTFRSQHSIAEARADGNQRTADDRSDSVMFGVIEMVNLLNALLGKPDLDNDLPNNIRDFQTAVNGRNNRAVMELIDLLNALADDLDPGNDFPNISHDIQTVGSRLVLSERQFPECESIGSAYPGALMNQALGYAQRHPNGICASLCRASIRVHVVLLPRVVCVNQFAVVYSIVIDCCRFNVAFSHSPGFLSVSSAFRGLGLLPRPCSSVPRTPPLWPRCRSLAVLLGRCSCPLPPLVWRWPLRGASPSGVVFNCAVVPCFACLACFACSACFCPCFACSVCFCPCFACSACFSPCFACSACFCPCFACSACFCPCFACSACFFCLSSLDSLSPCVCPCACLSVSLCACQSVSQCACLLVSFCAFPSFSLEVRPSVGLDVCPSPSLSVCPSCCVYPCPSVCLSCCPSLCLSVCQSCVLLGQEGA